MDRVAKKPESTPTAGSPRLDNIDPSATPIRPTCSAPRLLYHGGRVLGAVEVVPIYWGKAWTTGPDAVLATDADAFFDFILNCSLMDLLHQYSTPDTEIVHGRSLPSVYFSDCESGKATLAGRQLTDEDVQKAMRGWIASETVPPPTENTLYFIFLPPGVTSIGHYFQPSVGGRFYGYHSNMGNVYYVVVPQIDPSESIFGSPLDTLTAVSSRELCAAITNPDMEGWCDQSNNEIGSVVIADPVRVGGYLMQPVWSNEHRAALAIQPPNARAMP